MYTGFILVEIHNKHEDTAFLTQAIYHHLVTFSMPCQSLSEITWARE